MIFVSSSLKAKNYSRKTQERFSVQQKVSMIMILSLNESKLNKTLIGKTNSKLS